MAADDAKKICLDLLQADSEAAVVEILTKAGYWNDSSVWRWYGDRESNYATIGNQQGRPEAALVEKIVNCVDARLMNECQRRGIDPRTDKAPTSIRHAVSQFIEGKDRNGEVGGLVKNWPQKRQLEQAQHITLAATGSKTAPCIVIADQGEGQTPERIPSTFLSLVEKSNKLRIPFVQGKFNMGGSGVLKFGGREGLQLIITKRNPEIVKQMKETDARSNEWGFTVIRRERPSGEAGSVRNSVFCYLAPIGADTKPSRGEVISFKADSLPLMPDGNMAYARSISYGSCIKLYEYDMKGFKSNILIGRDCLKTRLEALLPEPALPIRLHECRDFKGHKGSFATTMLGVLGRLEEDRKGNIEDGFPAAAPLRINGQDMTATIYALKGDKGNSYRTNEGIIFTINGQTHGSLPKTFYSRNAVKMGRLADSLLVFVECSKLAVDAREDLFMNSRDRLSSNELRKEIEDALEELIGKHAGLRELRDRRRNEEVAERLEDSKPLEDVLAAILKSSPALERLFLLGQRLSRPFKAGSSGDREGGGAGGDEGAGEFIGRPHPTFFRFQRKKNGEMLSRTAELGRRCRIKMETDVVNEYFSRDANQGRYNVAVVAGALEGVELNSSLTLHNGIANWSISIPADAILGDELAIECTIGDDTLVEPFVNVARLRIVQPSENGGGDGDRNGRKGRGESGTGGSGAGGKGGTQGADGPPEPAGIQMPKIIRVKKDGSLWNEHKFDEKTACKIVEDGAKQGDEEKSLYTFYVNVDNIALRTDMKSAGGDVAVKESKFIYANVLVGLALIHECRPGDLKRTDTDDKDEGESVEVVVERTTRALAPFIVPMIDYLGALTAEEAAGIAQAGDNE